MSHFVDSAQYLLKDLNFHPITKMSLPNVNPFCEKHKDLRRRRRGKDKIMLFATKKAILAVFADTPAPIMDMGCYSVTTVMRQFTTTFEKDQISNHSVKLDYTFEY